MAAQKVELVTKHKGQGRSYWLYEHECDSLGELLERLDGMLTRDQQWQITSLVLISKADLLYSMDSLAEPPFSAKTQRVDRDGGMITVKIGREGTDETGRIRVAKTQDPSVYLAITDGGAQFVQRLLMPFVRSIYPDVSRAFLSSGEMRKALDILEQESGGAVSIVNMTAYRRLGNTRGNTGKSLRGGSYANRTGKERESAVTYTDRPYREAFDEAMENDQWINRVRLRLVQDNAPTMECQISRQCMLKFRLSVQPFCANVLSYVVRLTGDKTKFYSGRSRMENGGKVMPLAIKLGTDVFNDRTENKRFIRSMRSMPHATISVYHANPYVHLSLVDYMDGSSFDIWILSTNKITIVPQLRATPTSIARLTNHIFERFGEGHVEEH